MKKDYTHIVFDLGNTLVRFDYNISVGKAARFSSLDPKSIYDAFFDSEIKQTFERGKMSAAEFHKRISSLLGADIPYDEFVPIWNEIFWEDEEACALARELKTKYKLFLLTNVNSLHFEYIRGKFSIIKIFDEIILSYLVGAIKPDRAIFDHVVKLAGGDRSQLLYIDDREDLIKEATSLGIDSIRFENAAKLRSTMTAMGLLPGRSCNIL